MAQLFTVWYVDSCMSDSAPLIVTLCLDESAQAFFDALRREHFPPERNWLAAHLTLFHHLPDGEPSIISTLQRQAAQHTSFPLAVVGVVFIGTGVAYKLESDALLHLHAELQSEWKEWLIPQDRQRLWPHVMVQNKVPAPVARTLYEQLAKSFTPFTAYATGLGLWAYRGGPWEALATYPFIGQEG